MREILFVENKGRFLDITVGLWSCWFILDYNFVWKMKKVYYNCLLWIVFQKANKFQSELCYAHNLKRSYPNTADTAIN